MARFLVTMLPANDLGLPTRLMPIARALADRGHEIAVCNPAPAPSKLIAEAGLTNLPIRPRPAPAVVAPGTSAIWNVDHFMAVGGYLDEQFTRDTTEAFIEVIEGFEPDVVIDSFSPSACLAARILRTPLISIIQGDFHPRSQGFLWWREPPPELPTPAPVMNTVRAAYGLPPINSIADLFVGDLTLIAGTPETDPLPLDALVTYIGPMVQQQTAATLPDWVTALNRERPLIWIYSGNPRYRAATWGDSFVVIAASIAALADEPVQVILTTGHQALPDDIPALPANFQYAPYLPGVAMAERADLLIHHGGHGSYLTGLYAGTPAVIIPTYAERESNARRNAALGAGLFIVPKEDSSGEKRVSPDELRASVRAVLSDASYTANARRVSASIRAYGGPARAASRIEEFVASVTSSPLSLPFPAHRLGDQ